MGGVRGEGPSVGLKEVLANQSDGSGRESRADPRLLGAVPVNLGVVAPISLAEAAKVVKQLLCGAGETRSALRC